jgi:hypothetical protein
LNPTAAIADAVTVPSLQGVGFDALAGLVHPYSAGPDAAAHATAGPGHASLEDMATFAPIGLDNVIHIDSGEVHAIHSSLPHAGSGLI